MSDKNRLYMTITLTDDSRRISCHTDYDNSVSWDKLLVDVANAFHGYGFIKVNEKVFIEDIGGGGTVMLQDVEPYIEDRDE